MRAYVDADVLIWHLRGFEPAQGLIAGLRANPAYELWVGAMQRAEILFFMRPEEEAATLALFSQFKTAPVSQEVVDAAGGNLPPLESVSRNGRQRCHSGSYRPRHRR